MDTATPPFQTGEYIILTGPYHGLPAGSVGMITGIDATDPPRYQVFFGPSVPSRPIPQNRLAHLTPAHPRAP